MRFRTTIMRGGKTATGMSVPPEVVEGLGQGKRPPVRVTINGYSYRSTVAVLGGVYMLPVSAEARAGAGVAAGEEVEVEIVLDDAPREVSMPPDFSEALAADVEAQRAFDALSYSNKRRLVLPVEEAKTAETRSRRIAKAISALREGRAN